MRREARGVRREARRRAQGARRESFARSRCSTARSVRQATHGGTREPRRRPLLAQLSDGQVWRWPDQQAVLALNFVSLSARPDVAL